MRKTLWAAAYILAFILATCSIGYFGAARSMAFILAAPPARGEPILARPAPAHDAARPTVVVLLGNTTTESTDFLGPYAMFAESGSYNVYAVASSRTLRTLSGGLDVIPQLSFAELDARLLRGADIVVVPAVANIGSAENRVVIDWLRKQGRGRALLFAWCEGAEVLAAAGLLDGKEATTHWGSIDRYEHGYPAVKWQRGERYIDRGALLTTAGLTSGIDATLHFLETRNGRTVAERVAHGLNLPWSDFVSAPRMQQYSIGAPDSIFLLNIAFGWPKPRIGLQLVDGVDELGVSAVLDVYQATDRIYTVADSESVVSRHGLQLVPRWSERTLPAMNRTLAPDGEFGFQSALEDLARTHNRPSAVFAAKRLEVRSPLVLEGSKVPWSPLFVMVLAGMTGVLALAASRLCTRTQGKCKTALLS